MLLNKSSKKPVPKHVLKQSPFTFSYESMGTWWEVRIWDTLTPQDKRSIQKTIIQRTQEFDRLYSRFIPDSFVLQEFSSPGRKKIPIDLYNMLKMYADLYDATGGKFTPLIGQALIDAGYDADYTLKPKTISKTPPFPEVIEFISPTEIILHESVTLDLGALGKGYFVDKICEILKENSCTNFLVNGSGDLRYITNANKSLKIGLEHPDDPKKIIGTTTITNEALCASGSNRRSWGNFHHIIDPHTQSSPTRIIATWVKADTTALADALATCLFLVPPSQLISSHSFEYVVLSRSTEKEKMEVARSQGFSADLY